MKQYKPSNFVLIVLLGLISFGIYANALGGDFLVDDQAGILNNERIHDAKAYFSNHFKIAPGILYELTQVLNWHISGDNPFFYHLFFLICHIGCVILLFVLCEVLFKNKTLSFLSSLIFAIHPIHTEVVSWISGGNYALTSLFFIASFIFFVKSDKSLLNLTLSIVAFGLCLLAGAAVAVLPIMFILYVLFFKKESIKDKASRRFQLIVLCLVLVISFVVIATFFVSRNKYIHLIFYFRGFKYLIVAAKAFVYYLKILFLPLQRGLYHPFAFNTSDIQIVSPALFLSITILIISAISFFKCRRKFRPVSFGIMWFFVAYLPYSNIIPVCNIISERYLYLPSIGFSIIMAALFLKAWEIINKRERLKKIFRPLSIVILTLFLGSYATLTMRRNYEYHNILTYWWTNINNFPDGYIVYNNLARTFYQMGDLNGAAVYCYTNLMVNPNQPHVWCNLGMIYSDLGDFQQARYCYQQALDIDKNYLIAIKALERIKTQ